jgi:hypothetical protein
MLSAAPRVGLGLSGQPVMAHTQRRAYAVRVAPIGDGVEVVRLHVPVRRAASRDGAAPAGLRERPASERRFPSKSRSRRLAAVARLTMAAVVVALLTPAPAWAHGGTAGGTVKSCGSLPAEVVITDMRARNASCRTARRTARGWLRRVFNGRCTRFYCEVGDYVCRARRPARVSYRVRCRALGGRRVGWLLVAD